MELEAIDASNWRSALQVRVTDEQLPWVADYQPVALVILAKTYVGHGGHRWEPLLVRLRGGAVAGVLALEHKSTGACEIRNFAIDASLQRQGVGTAATRAVVAWTSRPGAHCTALAVSAHPDNDPAHKTYRGAGFTWEGELRDSEPLMRLRLDG